MERRRTLLVIAALIPLFAVVDALVRGNGIALDVLAVRVCWSLTLVICALGLLKASPRGYRLRLVAAATSTPLFFAIICARLGGTISPLWGWGLAIPVGIAALLQDEVEAALGGAVGSFIGTVVLLSVEHAPLHQSLMWLLLTLASAIITGYAAFSFRRLRGAELRETQERIDAQAQLRQSERRRAQSEKLAVVGQLATGVAHEVRNPLMLAMLQIDFLAQEKLSEPTRERIVSVNRALERISQIVNDLRVFARADGDSPTLEDVSVAEVLTETLRLADLRLKGVARVEQSHAAELPLVRAQRRQLSQVLLNLLVNAADALEEQHRSNPLIRIAVGAHADRVRIAVEDNGPGIAEDVLPRLFEPFFTTKSEGKGTGLGLALSREYVERFGGELTVENRQEGGARFIIDLAAGPAAQPLKN